MSGRCGAVSSMSSLYPEAASPNLCPNVCLRRHTHTAQTHLQRALSLLHQEEACRTRQAPAAAEARGVRPPPRPPPTPSAKAAAAPSGHPDTKRQQQEAQRQRRRRRRPRRSHHPQSEKAARRQARRAAAIASAIGRRRRQGRRRASGAQAHQSDAAVGGDERSGYRGIPPGAGPHRGGEARDAAAEEEGRGGKTQGG